MTRLRNPAKDEMTYPDWKKRLARARRETGSGVSLETYLKKRSKTQIVIPAKAGIYPF